MHTRQQIIDIPIRFQLCGPNAFVNDTGTSATQINSTAMRSYVFTNRPIEVNEKITIGIHKLHRNTFDTLGFGLTSCNPLGVKIDELPDDSDELVERSEYWACVKNVSEQ
ncbi:Protein neuralized-like protein [Aphelenchoides besseyi]|nr:Protein neuralized-like protein [Aphelenchoides besseyi]KAI6209930.1 Protein neuralized-like protein [Aphelenchoides besseyi]